MSMKSLSLQLAHPALSPATPTLRRSAAVALLGASHALQDLARRLATSQVVPPAAARVAELEFHAEAGAPEGALYVDGRYVAHLPGVSRL